MTSREWELLVTQLNRLHAKLESMEQGIGTRLELLTENQSKTRSRLVALEWKARAGIVLVTGVVSLALTKIKTIFGLG